MVLFPGDLLPQLGCCNVVDAAKNHSNIFQLNHIKAFIQSKATKRIIVISDEEFSHLCPKLLQHFGKPLFD